MHPTDWLRDAKWGVFCHWLGMMPEIDRRPPTAEEWNARVEAFDLAGLVGQLVRIHPGYFIFTLGQNSGHFCSPNATYDRLTGIQPSKCSRRDLIVDLAGALAEHGIPLMVYLPSGAPSDDKAACQRLQWEWGFAGEGWSGKRTGKRLAEFQRNWEAVVREWSLRFGSKIRGWWIDGCYFADEMYRHPDEPNFGSFAAALRAGNPQSLAAFNPGVLIPVVRHSDSEDYTAGEIAGALPQISGRWVEGCAASTF